MELSERRLIEIIAEQQARIMELEECLDLAQKKFAKLSANNK